ncbi:outer membrane protein [Lichenibacterium ramalinae]|nr:hypothetical protein [Lichenibacterium ramalinae]
MRRALMLAAVLAAGIPAAARAAEPLPLLIAVPPPATTPSLAATAAAPLPGMALDPQVPESIYHGLYIGSEIVGVGGRGIKGGIGGYVYAGYDRVLSNGMLLGLQGTTGYTPSVWGRPGLKGFDFGEASAQVGYPMGRVTPFVTAGLLVARPVVGPGLVGGTTDSVNDLMNGAGNLYAAPRVGAGFAYALTGNTTLAFDVTVGRGLASGLP